jgi:hypothetical protein
MLDFSTQQILIWFFSQALETGQPFRQLITDARDQVAKTGDRKRTAIYNRILEAL